MAYLLLATDYPPQVGGIQSYHSHLAAALQQLGRRVHIVATEYPGAAEYDATSPVPVTRVSAEGNKLRITRRLRDEAIRGGWELQQPIRGVISTKWSPEGLGALEAARGLKVPWGVFGHDREFVLHGGNPLKWGLQQHLFHHADFCFAISNYAADNFGARGVPRGRIRMVGCGIDSDLFQPDLAGATALRQKFGLAEGPLLLTLARVVPRKGHLTVIEALPEITKRLKLALPDSPPPRYLIVGDGKYLPVLHQAVEARGLQQQVIFAGRAAAEDLCAWYTLADAMVMPSMDLPGQPTEGFGLSFLEANCCETPVIGSRTGGIPDAVDHGLTGLLVPPREPVSLARVVERLLTDPERAAEMGRYGRQRAQQSYRWELVARRVDAAFDELWDTDQ